MSEKESSRTAMERHCLVIRDEQEFCLYIESRLREEGFELVETSPIAGWSPRHERRSVLRFPSPKGDPGQGHGKGKTPRSRGS